MTRLSAFTTVASLTGTDLLPVSEDQGDGSFKTKNVAFSTLKTESWVGLATVATSGSYNDLTNKPVAFYQAFVTTKTTDYTIQQSDHGLWIPCNTNNLTITFPSNLTNGTQVIIDRQGTATVSFAVTGGATLVSKSTAIANQYGVVAAVFNETENYWRLTGDL